MTTSSGITDPTMILPLAVESAQRAASEYVARALDDAERRGYRQGLADGAKSRRTTADLQRRLAKAAEVLASLADEVDALVDADADQADDPAD